MYAVALPIGSQTEVEVESTHQTEREAVARASEIGWPAKVATVPAGTEPGINPRSSVSVLNILG